MKLLRGVISFLKDTFYYLIAVPILFLVNKFVLGYKLIGKENIKKVPGAKITISNHVHTIDCSMNGLVSFPQYCYFVNRNNKRGRNCSLSCCGSGLLPFPIHPDIPACLRTLHTLFSSLFPSRKVSLHILCSGYVQGF